MPRITKSMMARFAEQKSALSPAALETIETMRIRYRDIMNLKGVPATPDSMPKGEYRRVMAAALHSFITPDNHPHPSKVNPNFYVLDIR